MTWCNCWLRKVNYISLNENKTDKIMCIINTHRTTNGHRVTQCHCSAFDIVARHNVAYFEPRVYRSHSHAHTNTPLLNCCVDVCLTTGHCVCVAMMIFRLHSLWINLSRRTKAISKERQRNSRRTVNIALFMHTMCGTRALSYGNRQ